jgi:RIO-like serine/threonine protein kinase
MFETLRRSDLQRINAHFMRKPSSTRPSIYSIEEKGAKAVVKDFSANGILFRNLIGRFLVWRENKAYRKLGGVAGTPALYGVVDGLALVLEHIPGKNLEEAEHTGMLPGSFFDDLTVLVEAFHRRGICHCDLKRAANILVGMDGKPTVIDWSAAILEREFRFYPFRPIYRRFLVDDLNAVTKYRLRHCPETVSDEARRRYLGRSGSEKMIRTLRDRLRRLLQRMA